MAKEKKIGVMVIAALTVVFVLVVVMKFTGTNDKAIAGEDGVKQAVAGPQEKPKLSSGPSRTRYVTAERPLTTAPIVRPELSPTGGMPNTTADQLQWRDSATEDNQHTGGSTSPVPGARDRYSGQYAAVSQTSTVPLGGTLTGVEGTGAEEVDPFQSRAGESRAIDDQTQYPVKDRTSSGDTSLSPPPIALTAADTPDLDQGNPLRRIQQPARLVGAELPVESSRRGDSSMPTQSLSVQRDPTGGSHPASTRYDDPLQTSQVQEPVSPGKYIVGPNDNYWTISARVYGTGKFFKSLFEHNRHRYPDADDLHVGDSLDVPEVEKLEELYPDLCPKRRRAAVQPRGYTVSTAGHGGNVYVVEEGDTLFNIARHQLGKAARWAEIYQLNRGILGDDIDFVSPGMELVLPRDGARNTDTITQRPNGRLRR